MRVALAQVDGKWPNLALAKLAAWHKSLGDDVQWFNAMFEYDIVLASKVFTDTPDDLYLPVGAARGGSGYDIASRLPDDIEKTRPDWSFWPWWKNDMGYTTRGCIRHCPFCIVPQKEGALRVVAEFGDVWTGRKHLTLCDNNITAAPIEHFRKVCDDATAAGVTFDFNQGIDARLLTDEHAAILARSSHTTPYRMSFDHPRDEPDVLAAIETFRRTGVSPHRLMFYVLVGFDTTPEEDMHRVLLLQSLKADPFVMRWDRTDRYQTRFARWVNNMIAFNSMTWEQWNARFKTKVATP